MVKFLHIAVILLFGVTVISSGCHTPTPSGPPVSKKIPSLSDTGLSGTSWRWVYSGILGADSVYNDLNPRTVNYNLSMRFSNDSLFSFFRNDTLVETADYHILSDTTEPAEYNLHQISLQNNWRAQSQINKYHVVGYYPEHGSIWIALKGDTLILNLTPPDEIYDSYKLIQ